MKGKYTFGDKVASRSIGGNGKTDEQCAQESAAMKPTGLSELEESVWDRVCVLLLKEQRMKPLFVDALREYCFITARMREITSDFAGKKGRTYEVDGRNGKQQKNRPEMAERNELFRQWNSLVAQFGLSPAQEIRFNNSQLGLPLGDGNDGGWSNFPDA